MYTVEELLKRKGETDNNLYDAHLTGQNIYTTLIDRLI